MSKLMRCPYCGLLQDEPEGTKSCPRCGGGLEFEKQPRLDKGSFYLQVQMELDQIAAPAGRNVERHLMVTIRAPKQVPTQEAAASTKKRPPVNFASVLDVSGSMQGEKIAQAKEAVRQAVRYLHSDDVFSLVTFSNEVKCAFEPVSVDAQTVNKVESALQEMRAGGMTALCGGLEKGIECTAKQQRDTNLVMLLSDGQANVGETDLEKIGQRARAAREEGSLVSTLGIGLDYNEALMAEIATQGGGRFYHLEEAGKIPAFVAGELGEAAAMAAREVELYLDIPAGATLVPLSAAYPVKQAEEQAVVSVGDIPCDTELEIPLRLALLAQSAGTKLSLEGKLEFTSPAGHTITASVNRVTVRFVESSTFQLREGMVFPVAERVFSKLKAACVLDISRARALRPAEAGQKTQVALEELNAYANLLGKERAEREMLAAREQFSLFAVSPAAAKQAAAEAHRSIRASKDFSN